MKTPVTLTGYVVVALLEAGMSSQVSLLQQLFCIAMFSIPLFQRKGNLNNITADIKRS